RVLRRIWLVKRRKRYHRCRRNHYGACQDDRGDDVRLRCRAAPPDLGRLDAGNFAVRGGVCERTGKRRAALSADPSALSMPIGSRSPALARPIGSSPCEKSSVKNLIFKPSAGANASATDGRTPTHVGKPSHRACCDSLSPSKFLSDIFEWAPLVPPKAPRPPIGGVWPRGLEALPMR